MQQFFDLPEWAKDALHVESDVHLDWRERLKVLFGAVVHVHTTTFCGNMPGRAESKAQVNVYFERPLPMGGGTAEAEARMSAANEQA